MCIFITFYGASKATAHKLLYTFIQIYLQLQVANIKLKRTMLVNKRCILYKWRVICKL